MQKKYEYDYYIIQERRFERTMDEPSIYTYGSNDYCKIADQYAEICAREAEVFHSSQGYSKIILVDTYHANPRLAKSCEIVGRYNVTMEDVRVNIGKYGIKKVAVEA